MPVLAAYYVVVFLVGMALSAFTTRMVRDFAVKSGIVSAPTPGRHIHRIATPRLGGVAIVVTIFAVTALSVVALHVIGIARLIPPARSLTLLLAGGLVVFAVGLYDDLRHASPALKIAAQTLAACLIYVGGFRFFGFVLIFGDTTLSAVLALPLTIIWVIWITNAFNLIDGLDGLAAGAALVPAGILFVLSLFRPNPIVSILSIALAGSILGFLRYNFNPASVFLGDSGSMFIGFILSALSLAGRQKTPTLVAVATPLLLFGLPLLDTVLSVVRRFLGGRPIFAPDREHIHHKLLDRGFSQRSVVVLLYGASAVFAFASLATLYPNGAWVAVILFMLAVGTLFGIRALGYHELAELARVASNHRNAIRQNVTLRKGIESLAAAPDLVTVQQVLVECFQRDFDGFRLVARTRPALASTEVVFDWRGATAPKQTNWELKLALSDERGTWGTLELYRHLGRENALVDINLVSTQYVDALTAALVRVALQSPPTHEAAGHSQVAGASA